MPARSRKLALAEASSREEIADAFPSDDAVVVEMASFVEETRANERICLWCGGDGSRHEGCSHEEVARLHEPSRAAGEIVARLRRAAAEHRAASRALRALVTSELGRGRAELETRETPVEAPEPAPETPAVVEPAPVPEAVSLPCPRCAEREAEAEVAPVVTKPPRPARKRGRPAVVESESTSEIEAAPVAAPIVAPVTVAAPRTSRKRGHVPIDQQSFAFLRSEPARLEGENEEPAPDSEPLPF